MKTIFNVLIQTLYPNFMKPIHKFLADCGNGSAYPTGYMCLCYDSCVL